MIRERGWLFPYLLALDSLDTRGMKIENNPIPGFCGSLRWCYWMNILESETLPQAPIPYISFDNRPRPDDEKAIQALIRKAISTGDYSWYDQAWLAFVKWLLHGFGRQGLEREMEQIPQSLRDYWYTNFNLANLLNSQCDWSAFVLQGGFSDDKATKSPWAQSTAFYSTPMPTCRMMVEMLHVDAPNFMYAPSIMDERLLTACDPAAGTGSLLLVMSNYSLRLYGQDIVQDLCYCAELNGYLFAPWLVTTTNRINEVFNGLYNQMYRLQRLRNIIVSPDLPSTPTELPPAPLPGVKVSKDDPATLKAVTQRRESYSQLQKAIERGEVEQFGFDFF